MAFDLQFVRNANEFYRVHCWKAIYFDLIEMLADFKWTQFVLLLLYQQKQYIKFLIRWNLSDLI